MATPKTTKRNPKLKLSDPLPSQQAELPLDSPEIQKAVEAFLGTRRKASIINGSHRQNRKELLRMLRGRDMRAHGLSVVHGEEEKTSYQEAFRLLADDHCSEGDRDSYQEKATKLQPKVEIKAL